jgi:hypothetical protein
MGRRRGRRAPACAFGALAVAAALLAAGCGVEEHANEPRPQPSTRVSIAVGEDEITVQPARIAVGPEPSQQIPQNVDADQPQVRSNAPVEVVLVAANLTDVDSRLELRGGSTNASSKPLVANGAITLQAQLTTGVYSVRAAGLPGTKPGRLVVGPYRTSSENDLLLP